MRRRDFLKSAAAFASLTMLPSSVWAMAKNGKVRTAFIAVGGKGYGNLQSIASHPMVEVIAMCDVDSKCLGKAAKLFPKAELFADYRVMMDKLGKHIDAVAVSTPDHTHAPASMLAMEMGKPVFCEKPLTHHVSEARAMRQYAEDHNLVTQMGIQCHSSDVYRQAVILIQSGIIGKVSEVHAWSHKNWGYDGEPPLGSDPVPESLNWNLWLGTSPKRPYKEKVYHPGNWRKLLDYGCGTLGDMGVHIFDTPYTALNLDVPETVKTKCRKPTGFGHPENNVVKYRFPGTEYTTKKLEWIWHDGPGAPKITKELELPHKDKLPKQGAMFIGEEGRMLLPHWEALQLIVDGAFKPLKLPELEKKNHYHQFIDTILGKDECSASFTYGARLTESILLGVIANRFPNKKLHWDIANARFVEDDANKLLNFEYRKF